MLILNKIWDFKTDFSDCNFFSGKNSSKDGRLEKGDIIKSIIVINYFDWFSCWYCKRIWDYKTHCSDFFFQVKIQSKRTDFSNVNSKIGSRAHIDHKPAGGEKKVGNWLVLNDIDWLIDV